MFTIVEKEGKYFVYGYSYLIDCSSFRKLDFNKMVPHWIYDRDNPLASLDNIDDARKFVLENIEIKGKYAPNFHYFVLPENREDNLYHEFKKGNKDNWKFNKDSILLNDDCMDDSGFRSLLERIVPNYDYCGTSLVNKETWELLKKEAKNDSQIVQEIVEEMKPWADNCIDFFGCFTIEGI